MHAFGSSLIINVKDSQTCFILQLFLIGYGKLIASIVNNTQNKNQKLFILYWRVWRRAFYIICK